MSAHANVLFVGLDRSAQCWYRCALPARALGADWAGVAGQPPELAFRTGEARRPLNAVGDFAAYDVVVLQMPSGKEWVRTIRELQAGGTRVLFEIDDYAHGVRNARHHAAADTFDKARLAELELAMGACDGIICSTDYIAGRYRAFNSTVWVCRNGLDLGRYAVTRREREVVTIGWAGGTAHRPALLPWLRELLAVMDARPNTRFMSVGVGGYAAPFAERFGAARAIGLPWALIETYPAAMANFDIALAPATNSAFFRGKSDLRWLEAGALGIALVGDPVVYPDIEHGVTGLHAADPAQAREAILALVDDPSLRRRIGEAARAHVRAHRSSAAVAPQWAAALEQVRELPRAA
ncbi:MAG TPA: glycosyltransferase [Solirubrobacteraceae bacterium]|nr:glycosyltransferase [Solirubrobacteraceae bacterium]